MLFPPFLRTTLSVPCSCILVNLNLESSHPLGPNPSAHLIEHLQGRQGICAATRRKVEKLFQVNPGLRFVSPRTLERTKANLKVLLAGKLVFANGMKLEGGGWSGGTSPFGSTAAWSHWVRGAGARAHPLAPPLLQSTPSARLNLALVLGSGAGGKRGLFAEHSVRRGPHYHRSPGQSVNISLRDATRRDAPIERGGWV